MQRTRNVLGIRSSQPDSLLYEAASRRARVLSVLGVLLVAVSTAACSSCRKTRQQPPQPTDQDGPVPLPSTPALPQVTWSPVLITTDFALPARCSFVGRIEKLSVDGASVRVLAPSHAVGDIALAHEPPAGLGPAPVRGLVGLSSRAVRDLPWFQLDDPPLVDQSGDSSVTLFEAPSKGSRNQAVLAVAGQPFARIAAGDQLHVAGLSCTSAACAVLTTRASDVAAPGATLFVGPPTAPPSAWNRTDIDGASQDEMPIAVLDVDGSTSSARIALASAASARFVGVGGGRSQTDDSLPTHSGILDVAWSNGAYVLASHGAAVDDRSCAPNGASVVFQRSGGEPHQASVSAPPYKGHILTAGAARVFVWLAAVNCLVPDRRIVYAQLLDQDAAPVDTAIPIADARDFAARAVGDRIELFLVRDDGVFSMSARCAPPSP